MVPRKKTGRPSKPAKEPEPKPETLAELQAYTWKHEWAGTKGAATADANSRDVVKRLGPELPVDAVDAAAINRLKAELKDDGLAEGTINRKLSTLSKMLGVAMTLKVISSRPVFSWNPEEQGRTRFLTETEELAVFAALRQEGYDDVEFLCKFLLDTGLRVSEALKLRWEDIGEGTVTVWVAKNKRPRTVPLTRRARHVLEERRGVALGPWADISQNYLTYRWNVARDRMGLSGDNQFVPHALRHTCATRLVLSGVPLPAVKEWLGHSSLRVTARYLHMGDQQLRDARDKLEGFGRGR